MVLRSRFTLMTLFWPRIKSPEARAKTQQMWYAALADKPRHSRHLGFTNEDSAYAMRAAQAAENTISLAGRNGTVEGAKRLLTQLGDLIGVEQATQIRRGLAQLG